VLPPRSAPRPPGVRVPTDGAGDRDPDGRGPRPAGGPRAGGPTGGPRPRPSVYRPAPSGPGARVQGPRVPARRWAHRHGHTRARPAQEGRRRQRRPPESAARVRVTVADEVDLREFVGLQRHVSDIPP
jgi:hypothetical protein